MFFGEEFYGIYEESWFHLQIFNDRNMHKNIYFLSQFFRI